MWHLGDSRFEPTLKVDYRTFEGQYVAWHDGVELAFSPDSRSLALGFHEFLDTWDFDPRADLHVWNLAGGNRLWSQTTDTETWHRCVAYSPDNRLVATGSNGIEGMVSKKWVVVRHVDTGTPVARWDIEGQTPKAVAFVGNDRVRAVTSGGLRWSAWEWRQDTSDGSQWEHDDRLRAAAYSPDGQRLAAAMYERVALFDAATGTELWSFAADLTTVLHFSPDGRWLVTGNWYGVRRYDVHTGVAQLDSAEAIAFAPNGYWAVHLDRTVHLHDTAGTPVRDLDPHRGTASGWQVAGLRLVRPSDLG